MYSTPDIHICSDRCLNLRGCMCNMDFRYHKVFCFQNYCSVMDADLVRIETQRENNFLVAEIKKLNPGYASIHYENTLMQYAAIFIGCKNGNFQVKIFDNFHIFANYKDCGYTLEPPQ